MLNLRIFKVVEGGRNFCYTLHPCDVQIALLATKQGFSIHFRP